MIETSMPGQAADRTPGTGASQARRSLAEWIHNLRQSMPWRADDEWERPAPGAEGLRRDVVGVVIALVLSALMLELMRGFAFGIEDTGSPWKQHLAQALLFLPLILRRRYPVAVMVLSSVTFLVVGLTVPEIFGQIGFQAAYFASLYSAVAWARNRRILWLGVTVVVAAMTLWIVLNLALSSGYDEMIAAFGLKTGQSYGLLPPMTSYALYTFMVNVAYFGGAIMFGMSSWRSAHQREQLAEQAVQLEAQAADLARRAVVEERLRIARELHDVVAHHIAVIGVQAGAARRVMAKKPEAAAGALQTIETSSRDAVAEMRALLGILRSADSENPESNPDTQRLPEPDFDDLPALFEECRRNGLAVTFNQVEDVPGALAEMPAPLALSVYRTVQESLANVRRHSTAGTAVVALRTGSTPGPAGNQRWVEVETVDGGRPRPGTAGSGYGLRGVRERAALHGGTTEIGPRDGGGWRVRVRFTLR